MNKPVRLTALASIVVLLVAACGSAGPSAAPSLLDVVTKAGKIRVSTDPNYAPQSFQNSDGTFEGFDIDVATEVAKRMKLEVEFLPQAWAAITAGNWGGRWDMSVGSMTVTPERKKVVDFSPPYYYTPAQMAASKASGITTIDGMAGKKICAGESTTYLDWLNQTEARPAVDATPPPNSTVVTQKTDADCAQQWAAGRNDFEGWLTAGPTVEEAIKQNQPVVMVGGPIYFEPLAIAVDKSGPDDATFVAKLKTIIDEMHADGTLSTLSQKYYGKDLTQVPK
jgi:polar amino acid transport system substrate-binding protein